MSPEQERKKREALEESEHHNKHAMADGSMRDDSMKAKLKDAYNMFAHDDPEARKRMGQRESESLARHYGHKSGSFRE